MSQIQATRPWCANWLGEWQGYAYPLVIIIHLVIPPAIWLLAPERQPSVPVYPAFTIMNIGLALLGWRSPSLRPIAAILLSIGIHSSAIIGASVNGLVPAIGSIPFMVLVLLLVHPQLAIALNGLATFCMVALLVVFLPEHEMNGTVAVLYVFAYLVGAVSVVTIERSLETARANFRGQSRSATRAAAVQYSDDFLIRSIWSEIQNSFTQLSQLMGDFKFQSKDKLIEELHGLLSQCLSITERGVSGKTEQDATISSNEVICVTQIVDHTRGAIAPLAKQHGIVIHSVGRMDYEAFHIGDQRPLRHVLQNLLKNACLHSGAEKITLVLSWHELDDKTDGFEILISDDGRGIPVSTVENLFDAETRGITDSEGSGWGLFVARKKARDLPQGDLRYLHHPTGGARFCLTFVLPRALENEHSPAALPKLLQGKEILVLIRSSVERKAVKLLLEKEEALVLEAARFDNALELIRLHPVDLILTDVCVAGQKATTLIEALHTANETVPVIGLYNPFYQSEAQRLLDAGAIGICEKPLVAAEITKILINVLRGELRHDFINR